MNGNGTRLYSDSEIDSLIDDISGIAKEAIEKAAEEAARAVMLAGLEREAEALRRRLEMETLKKDGKKRAFFTGLIGLLGGLTIGITGTLIIGGR